jgi:hypothetical protein
MGRSLMLPKRSLRLNPYDRGAKRMNLFSFRAFLSATPPRGFLRSRISPSSSVNLIPLPG